MIYVYDIAHAREDALREITPEATYKKYSNPAEIEKIADHIAPILMNAAEMGDPVAKIYEADVAAAINAVEGLSGYNHEGARFVTIKLVDWLRRNTQFRAITYTGDGADFLIEL